MPNLTKTQKEYLKSLRNFLNKSPVQTQLVSDDTYIYISGSTYGAEFELPYTWDDALDIPKKEFIHKVKTDLSHYYPTLIDHNYQAKELTPLELAIEAEQAADITKIPTQIQSPTVTTEWVIDKVAIWENILILKRVPDDGTHYKYKFNKSLLLFMKKLKAGFWTTPDALGDYFFQNAQCIMQDKNTQEENADTDGT